MLQKTLSTLDGPGAIRGVYGLSPKYGGIAGLVIQGYYFVVSVGAIPFKLIKYKNLGERSFGLIAFIVSFLFYTLLALVILITSTFSFYSSQGVLSTFSIVLISLALLVSFSTFYLIRLFMLGRKFLIKKYLGYNHLHHSTEHSYYRGDLRKGSFSDYKGKKILFFNGDNPDFVRMFFVPIEEVKYALIFILSPVIIMGFLLLIEVDFLKNLLFIPLASMFFTGIAVALSAIFAMLEEYGIFKRIRNANLDVIDSKRDVKLIANEGLNNTDRYDENNNAYLSSSSSLKNEWGNPPIVKIYGLDK